VRRVNPEPVTLAPVPGEEQLEVEAGAALLAGARRAAHHVIHLLKAERVAASEWFRNNDAATTAASEPGVYTYI